MNKRLVWLFDLDNTLHNASIEIFPKISENMNAYIAETMGESGNPLSIVIANQLRIAFWKRFGATLLGISEYENKKARDFLAAAHRFDDLSSLLKVERGLISLFKKLPGKKILLTNSANQYAENILKMMGLHHFFSLYISIESMRVHGKYEPKPSGKFFRKLLAILKVKPNDCILVEDNMHILKKAKSVGMQTVLVTQYLKIDPHSEHSNPLSSKKFQINRPNYIDLRISSVRSLPRHLNFIQ